MNERVKDDKLSQYHMLEERKKYDKRTYVLPYTRILKKGGNTLITFLVALCRFN